MTKRERAAEALEQKILDAIESGEFTPDYGYLNSRSYINGTDGSTVTVEIGPCGCALAAAASVNGIGLERSRAGHIELREYLKERVGMSKRDATSLEDGYEDNAKRATSLYFQLGQRLRRFHPFQDGSVQ